MALVLVCDQGGVPHHWANWQSAVIQKYKGNVSYEIGDSSVFFGGISRMTGIRSQIDVGQILFLKERLSYDVRTPPLSNKNLFARDLHLCAYCGRLYPEVKLSRDHIVPISKGGANSWKNCVTACKTCNHHKADRTPHEAEMELLYVPYQPSNIEKLLLQNRKILFDQMEYLKEMLPPNSRILKNAVSCLGLN